MDREYGNTITIEGVMICMKISKISLKNFRGINNIDLDLNQESTVFFGINGSGKSSILHAIIILYSQIISVLGQGKFKNKINFVDNDISYGNSFSEVKIDFSIEEQIFSYHRQFEKKTNKRTYSQRDLQAICEYLRENYILNDENGLPVFAHYGFNRAVLDIPLKIKQKHNFEKIMAFEKSYLIGTDFRTFFEWFRNQEDIENEQKVNDTIDYVDHQLNAVRKAINGFLPGFSNLRVQRNPLRMVISKLNKKMEISQLSDGEKCTFAMIGDLARRLAIANPSMPDPLNGAGVVLIDEIELHLHPEWQRTILPTLVKTFPNIQFIVTTHSPQVLGEIKDMNVFRLERSGDSIQCKRIKSTFGRNSGFILEQFMDADEKNINVKNEIIEMYKLINNKDFAGAKKIIDDLSKKVGNDDADVVKANILVSRGSGKNEADNKK